MDRAESEQSRVVEERRWMADLAAGGRAAERAAELLFRRYQPMFARRMRHKGFAPEVIEDVTQDFWITACRKAASFTPVSTPSAWLWKIFGDHMADAGRARKVDTTRRVADADPSAEDWIDPDTVDPPPRPEQRRQLQDLLDCVRKAFDWFKRRHADDAWLLYVRHVEDWDLKAVAEYRGGSLHAAEQALSKVRRALRPVMLPCRELQT